MPETTLQMAERHFREAGRRVVRQRELVAQLRQGGHGDAAAAAEALLMTFEAMLAEHRDYLELRRERKSARPPNSSV